MTMSTPNNKAHMETKQSTNPKRVPRIIALQALFEADISGHSVNECLQRLLQDRNLTSKLRNFAKELVLGVEKNKSYIDSIITQHAPASVSYTHLRAHET